MIETKIPLAKIISEAPLPPEGISPAVAVIANTDPSDLKRGVKAVETKHVVALDQVSRPANEVEVYEDSLNKRVSSAAETMQARQAVNADIAYRLQTNMIFESIVSGGQQVPSAQELDLLLMDAQEKSTAGLELDEQDQLDRTISNLEAARRAQAAAQKTADRLTPYRIFTKEINETKKRLSRPARWLTALACTATLSGAVAGGTYVGVSTAGKVAGGEQNQLDTRPDANSHQDEATTLAALAGGLSSFPGIVLGVGAGNALQGRFARRKAQKLVEKAKKAAGPS